MTVSFDPAKRLVTLRERGIDFATDAEKVFAGRIATLSTIVSIMVRFGIQRQAGSTAEW